MKRAIPIFVLGVVLSFLIFYVTSTEIFEVHITEYATEYTLDISLRTLIWFENFPDSVNPNALISAVPTAKGAVLLFICIVGLPGLITWRVTMKDPFFRRSRNPSSDEQDD